MILWLGDFKARISYMANLYFVCMVLVQHKNSKLDSDHDVNPILDGLSIFSKNLRPSQKFVRFLTFGIHQF